MGERQLVRYADEVLKREYDVSAQTQLLLMWTAYRQLRGTAADPLRCTDAAAAALAYNYLLIYGPKPGIGGCARVSAARRGSWCSAPGASPGVWRQRRVYER